MDAEDVVRGDGVRDRHQERDRVRDQLAAGLDRYRSLFELAPVAYLATDQVGVVREVNRRAAELLAEPPSRLVGRPLAGFVTAADRDRFRERLGRLPERGADAWELRLQPRRGRPRPLAVAAEVVDGRPGAEPELRWVLRQVEPGPGAPPPGRPPPPPAGAPPRGREPPPAAAGPGSGPPGPAPDWNRLSEALEEIIATAIPLLRADGAGLMLADRHGTLGWVTATNQAERAFEQAERDLGEGPCIDAFTSGRLIWTSDLRSDPRWPRLGPAARTNQVRGVLSTPVLLGDQPIGTCNALTTVPRDWTEADAGAVRAFGVMLGRLIGSIVDADHHSELTTQLQSALSSRVLIEQAKGVLMERQGIDARHAFELLRHQARSSERKLADVARDLLHLPGS
jgi:PAS domain S-box-containing protein